MRREIYVYMYIFSYSKQYCEWNMEHITFLSNHEIGYIFVCYERHCKSVIPLLELAKKAWDYFHSFVTLLLLQSIIKIYFALAKSSNTDFKIIQMAFWKKNIDQSNKNFMVDSRGSWFLNINHEFADKYFCVSSTILTNKKAFVTWIIFMFLWSMLK